MKRKLGFLSMAVAASCLMFSATAVADPTGDTYFLFTTNFGVPDTVPNASGGLPGDGVFGPIPVLWDGVEQDLGPLPGGGNMFINEHAAPWPGLPPGTTGTNLDIPGGELLEIWLRTDLPFLSHGDNVGETFTSFLDIDWLVHPPPNPKGQPMDEGRMRQSWLYFTSNGVPHPMFDAGGNALVFGPDPGGSGAQVLFLGDGPWFPDGAGIAFDGGDFLISSGALLAGLSYPILLGALGISGSIGTINDLHFGFIMDHVPEPTSALLLIMGAMALVPTLGRRRKR